MGAWPDFLPLDPPLNVLDLRGLNGVSIRLLFILSLARSVTLFIVVNCIVGAESIFTSNSNPVYYSVDAEDIEFLCNLVFQDKLHSQAEWEKNGEIKTTRINTSDHTAETHLNYKGSSYVCHSKRSAKVNNYCP